MSYMYSVLLSVHILVGLGVIGLVLLQHGKGADMGAAFGSGASGSLFGASGSANFLSRTTAVLAAMFFMTSLGLSYLASSKPREASSVMDRAQVHPDPAAPAAPAADKAEKTDKAEKDAPTATSKEPVSAGGEKASNSIVDATKDSPVKDIPK